MEKRRKIEIIIAAAFVVLLIAISICIVASGGTNIQKTTITNSYNTYNYYGSASAPQNVATAPVQTQQLRQPMPSPLPQINQPTVYVGTNYYPSNIKVVSETNIPSAPVQTSAPKTQTAQPLGYYDSSSKKSVETMFGTMMEEYNVDVKNEGYVGGYFKVIFYFKDYYGNEIPFVMTRYISAQKSTTFMFKDVSNKYQYYTWHYSVTSMTVPN